MGRIDNLESIIGRELIIVWDPAVIDAEQYAQLVTVLGDLVRAAGGLGIERVFHKVVFPKVADS